MGFKMTIDQDFLLESVNSINQFIVKYLNPQEIESIALQTKFVMRRSAILKGYDFPSYVLNQ